MFIVAFYTERRLSIGSGLNNQVIIIIRWFILREELLIWEAAVCDIAQMQKAF